MSSECFPSNLRNSPNWNSMSSSMIQLVQVLVATTTMGASYMPCLHLIFPVQFPNFFNLINKNIGIKPIYVHHMFCIFGNIQTSPQKWKKGIYRDTIYVQVQNPLIHQFSRNQLNRFNACIFCD